MICTNCGKQVSDKANVCGYCGHRLKSAPAEAAQPVVTSVQSQNIQAPLPVRPLTAPQATIWPNVLWWALPTSAIVYLREIVSTYMFYSSLGGTEITRFWSEVSLIGLAINSLLKIGLPCGIAGYLVARDRKLQPWSIGGLVFLYLPFLIAHFFFMGVSYGYVLDHPFALFVSNWSFLGGFGPLIGVLIGKAIKKFSQ